MANFISWLTDRKKENVLVPKTMTKAVYDDNGVALSDTLTKLEGVVLLNESKTVTADSLVLLDNFSEYRYLKIYYQCTGYSEMKIIPTEQLAYTIPLTIFASTSNYITSTLSMYNGQLFVKSLTNAGELGSMVITKIVGTY